MGRGILCYRCLVKLGDEVNVFCEGCGEFKPFTGFPVFRETKGLLLRRRICKDCYKPKGRSTVPPCKECGRITSLRLVEGRGALCNDCIRDDDLVLCPSCLQYKPWGDYRMINTKGWWDTLCEGCATTRKRGPKAMEWLGEEEEADLKMEMQFEDGVCWMGLNTAMRIVGLIYML